MSRKKKPLANAQKFLQGCLNSDGTTSVYAFVDYIHSVANKFRTDSLNRDEKIALTPSTWLEEFKAYLSSKPPLPKLSKVQRELLLELDLRYEGGRTCWMELLARDRRPARVLERLGLVKTRDEVTEMMVTDRGMEVWKELKAQT